MEVMVDVGIATDVANTGISVGVGVITSNCVFDVVCSSKLTANTIAMRRPQTKTMILACLCIELSILPLTMLSLPDLP
jgi:hypothetical protein